jgi:methylenetetrahydrofolate reductase (NADPH)
MSARSITRGFSFELFPPRNAAGQKRLARTLQELSSLGVEFATVTFGAGGSTREGSFATVREVLASSQRVAPHLSCVGSSVAQVREQIDRYRELGIDRIVAIRGDTPPDQPDLPFAFEHADGLVAFIHELGGFRISVACYPEFHPQASSPSADVEHFANKAKAGASEAITQYFYSNAAYERFVERVRARGVDIPIVPGIMPLTHYKQIARFSQFCGAEIPQWLRKQMEEHADDPSAQFELGVEIATRQAEELLDDGAPGLHFYTLNRSEPTLRVWKNLGL